MSSCAQDRISVQSGSWEGYQRKLALLEVSTYNTDVGNCGVQWNLSMKDALGD